MSTAIHENLTRDEAAIRAGLLSDVTYEVALDLTRGDEVFGCETTIRFAAGPGEATFIDCTARTVEEVVLNGTTLDLEEVVSPTRIALPELTDDNTLVIHATMRYLHEGRGLHFFRDPSDDRVYLHSQFEPFDAHQVFACFDQPDLKAPFTLAVEAPANWVVVSNAPVESRPDEGEAGRWSFEPTPPVSPYITAIVAGEYVSVHDRHGDIDLGLYVRRSLRQYLDADELFELTRLGFDWYNAHFGIAYPFGKYDQLFVPEFSAGAMENPGCVTFAEYYIFRGAVTEDQRERRAETLLHEMAHMWFGDLVTMRWWDDLWLNESFATFGSVLSMVEATKYDNAWVTFLDAEKAWAKLQDQLPTTHPIAADMVDIESVHQNFDGITYAKGASVLRQLVAYVGQDAFLEGVRHYFRAHQWDNAELADFLAALEGASGRELQAWTDAWLTTTGINTMSADYELADDNTFKSFAVLQGAAPEHPTLRPHRMAIGVYDDIGGKLARTKRVELDVKGDRTEVAELAGADAGRLVLLNDDDLTFTKVELDARTLAVVTEDVASFAEPMPRALVWSATWDMVRDGQLAASGYVDMVVANIESETETGVLSRLHQRSESAALRYADPAARDLLLTRLADQAMTVLDSAEPGSGQQLAWARQLAATATTDEQLGHLRDLLDERASHEGLAMDADLRWTLVTALTRAGAADDVLIDAELQRDPTDFGQRNAATARSARPDPGAKAAAWAGLVDDPDVTLTMARQLWGGFQQMRQPELVEPYVSSYLDALGPIWANRSTEWAIEFAQGMFPHPAASTTLLDQAGTARDREGLPGPLRRVLAEEIDTLERTLAARKVDAAS